MKTMSRTKAEALLALTHGTELPTNARYIRKHTENGKFYYGFYAPKGDDDEFPLSDTYEIVEDQ